MFELRNDYIRNPKEDGYKSIHLIGKFKNSEGELKVLNYKLEQKFNTLGLQQLKLLICLQINLLNQIQEKLFGKIF